MSIHVQIITLAVFDRVESRCCR